MIGQNQLTSQIDDLVKANKFPHFCIIEGAVGSGKKTLVRHIHDVMEDSVLMWMQNTVDDVRLAISKAYKGGGDMIYAFADADNMSMSAQNALLKITEEPPSNIYFILTVNNINNVLETIRSRAYIFRMGIYTYDELVQYIDRYKEGEVFKQIALDVCEVPGEIDLLYKIGAEDLHEFVNKVMDNIAEVSIANVMKIADSIAFTNADENKFDLRLFWKAVIAHSANYIKTVDHIDPDELHTVADVVKTTKECIQMIDRTRGINKRNVFDMWILDIRKILRGE